MLPKRLYLLNKIKSADFFGNGKAIQARIEFEESEKYFNQKEYENAIERLKSIDALYQKWIPKVGYLKILVLDKICDYGDYNNNNTIMLEKEVELYMANAKKNLVSKVDDRYRIVNNIQVKLKPVIKDRIENGLPEIIKASKLYDEKNYSEAMNWYLNAADKNNSHAMTMIGDLYANGFGVDQSWEKAIEWYKRAIIADNTKALVLLGDRYFLGEGAAKNYNEAIRFYKKAADIENIEVMCKMGILYSKGGYGVTQNYMESINWFKKAATKGNARAMIEMGLFYRHGVVVDKDYKEAMNWYLKAVDKEVFYGAYLIGNLYKDGLGVEKSDENALAWYKKAAKAEVKSAYKELGEIYYNSKNFDETIFWYIKYCESVEDSNKEMNRLGDLFAIGNIITEKINESSRDLEKSILWHTRAANKGNINSMYFLSKVYSGSGNRAFIKYKDKSKAKEWTKKYKIASKSKKVS
uniref:tetratricopeptide repeat protein n=1 Tax=Mariniflexile sp. TaxID=1979402 RepID=UPI0040482C67